MRSNHPGRRPGEDRLKSGVYLVMIWPVAKLKK